MSQRTQGRYELEDGNGQPVIFEGRCVARATSRRQADEELWAEATLLFGEDPTPDRETWLAEHRYRSRWMELLIFRTVAGGYVVEIVGQTTNDGEVIRSRAKVAETPDELIEHLHNTDERDNVYITYTARDALMDAMRDDPALEAAWRSRARVVA